MQLSHWQPGRDLEDVFRRARSLFDDTPIATIDEDGFNVSQWSPSADISETNDAFVIKAELPEVDKENIQVSVEDGSITIEGERRCEKESDEETFHWVENVYGKFMRRFNLPANADVAAVTADCKNGVLRVHIPKLAETVEPPAKRIEIK